MILAEYEAVCDRFGVPRETAVGLLRYAEMVAVENSRQNLVAGSTLKTFAERHIADSLQLTAHVSAGPTVDIGSGAGLPGIVLAIVSPSYRLTLVEPRARRATFLRTVVDALGLPVTVISDRIEAVTGSFRTVTARAVAPLDRLFATAEHVATPGSTRWVLPKGRTALDELAAARRTWQGDFELIPSATDPEASIVVAENVRRR